MAAASLRVRALPGLALLTACAAVPPGPPSMHLLASDVSGLQEVASPRNMHRWEAPDIDLSGFEAIHIAGVTVDFSGPDPGPLGAIDTVRIENVFRERLEVRLAEAGIALSPGAAPRVLSARLRLAGLRYGEPIRGATGETLRRHVDLRGLGIEGQFLDGADGRLAAVVLTRPPGTTSVAERWSELESVLDTFARNFAREVERAQAGR